MCRVGFFTKLSHKAGVFNTNTMVVIRITRATNPEGLRVCQAGVKFLRRCVVENTKQGGAKTQISG